MLVLTSPWTHSSVYDHKLGWVQSRSRNGRLGDHDRVKRTVISNMGIGHHYLACKLNVTLEPAEKIRHHLQAQLYCALIHRVNSALPKYA